MGSVPAILVNDVPNNPLLSTSSINHWRTFQFTTSSAVSATELASLSQGELHHQLNER
jgi:hypothetical protein